MVINCGKTFNLCLFPRTAAKAPTLPKKRGTGSNFIEFQHLSDRTMTLIITVGSKDGKNYTDCNSLCTFHSRRLLRAAPSFAFSFLQAINYSLLTLESELKQHAVHHQNRRSSRDDAVLQLQHVKVRLCTGVHVYIQTRLLTSNRVFVLQQLSEGVNSATTTSLFTSLLGELKKANLTEHLNPCDTKPG